MAETTAVVIDPQKAAFIAGLRALADHLEAHPDLCNEPPGYAPVRVNCSAYDDPVRFAELVRQLGGHRTKRILSDQYVQVVREIGPGVEIIVSTKRETVCAHVQAGAFKEWRCAPILAGVGAEAVSS